MNAKGTAQSEYASLSGKIHSLVIDKTLTISGACADSKATGEAIEKAMDSVKEESAEYASEKALEAVRDLAEDTARKAAVDSVNTLVAEAVNEFAVMTAEEVAAICV